MEKMLLATAELSDAATVTGPIGAGDMALSNLKTSSLQEFYRVIGNTIALDIDFAAATSIDTVALMGHNGSTAAYARVTAGATLGAATFDTGNVPMRSHQSTYGGVQSTRLAFDKNFFMQHFANQSYRYWRIVITDPSATYLDIGRLYVSDAFQPNYNMVWGMQNGFIDGSQEYETTSGDSISLKRKKKRFVDFTLQDLTEDEVYSQLFPLDKLLGQTGDVLFVPKPDEITYLQFNAVYGKIEQVRPFAWQSFNRFSRQYRIKELLP